MSAGQAFTVKTTFGVPIGPTYSGSIEVAPPSGGNNQPLIDQVVNHSASTEQTIYEAVAHANLQGFGFTAKLVALNGNTGVPEVKLRFKGAGPAGADLEYILKDGEAVAFPSSPLTGDATAVKVLPDTVSDFQVTGMLILTS